MDENPLAKAVQSKRTNKEVQDKRFQIVDRSQCRPDGAPWSMYPEDKVWTVNDHEPPHWAELPSSKVYDQGDLGSSTACAGAYLLPVGERMDPINISDIFLYYDVRQLEPPRSGVRRLVELLYRNGHIQ